MSLDIDARVAEDGAAVTAAAEQDKLDASQAAFVKSGGQAAPTGVSNWVTNLPKNVGVGLFDAAVNTLKTIGEMGSGGAVDKQTVQAGGALLQPKSGGDIQKRREASLAQPMTDPAHDNAMSHVMAFRDELAKGDTADSITQSAAQLLVPFMGWSKLLGVKNAASMVQKVARVAGAEALTASTAQDPQAPRMADLYQLGQHVEGKLGDTLNAIAPDGSAVNAYIDYMTDRTDEGAAEGRFKNIVDALVTSGVTAAATKTVASSLKAARKLPDYLPAPKPQEADPVQSLAEISLAKHGDAPTAIVNLKEQADLAQTPAERDQTYAVADRIRQQAGPAQGVQVVDTARGSTVVVGHEPTLTFAKREDADAAVADMHNTFGVAALERQATTRANLTDKNFDTLHSFSRVLQQNVDRPVSTHSLVTTLEKHLNGDTEQGAFYKDLLGRLRDKNLGGNTVVTGQKQDRIRAEYFPALNEVRMHARAFDSPQQLLHTFAHEAVHAATMRTMQESPTVYRAIERIRKAAETALRDQNAAARVGAGKAPPPDVAKQSSAYGFTNADEFVAEIESNPEFRAAMKKGKASDGETVWDKYLKTIAGILGVAGLATNPEFSKLMDPKVDTQADGEDPNG